MQFKGLTDLKNGYDGYSWSKRATEAYERGEKPMSKWRKDDIIEELSYIQSDEQVEAWSHAPASMLKFYCLAYTSYHHTGKYTTTRTNFYRVYLPSSKLTPKQILKEIAEYKKHAKEERQAKKAEQAKAVTTPDRWECAYLVWSGSRNYRHAKEVRDTGEIRGNWFYPDHDSCKKMVSAKGFRQIKKLEA